MLSRRTISMPQRALEMGTELKMALIMLLAGLLFRYAPSSDAFAKLTANGLPIDPDTLSMLCYLGSAAYAIQVLLTSLHPLRKRWRASIFIVASLPLYVYLGTLGLAALRSGFNATAFVYAVTGLVIFLLSLAVFEAYHRSIEIVTLIALALIMAISAYGFIVAAPAWLATFHIPTAWMVILFGAGAIGYWLLLHPAIRALPARIKRLWFFLSDAPLWVYATLIMLNMLNVGNGSLIVPVAFVALGLLITLFAYCFYAEQSRA